MKMGAKSAPKTTKWGQKAPPHKSELKKVWGQKVPSKWKSGGKKRRQNSKVTAKSATTQISEKKAMVAESESSPNLCVNSSSSYISPSMLPLSSGDLIEWSLVCHSTLSYQKFCD